MEVDYLLIGCGASAMAFLDTMLRETEATFAVVDKNQAPGGHWNYAYPFVRLHQPSSFYGVNSRHLGHDRIDSSGSNAGLFELASGNEVVAYYHDLMKTDFLPTGRVHFFPMTEYRDDGTVTSLISGEVTQIDVRRKLVDGRRLGTKIPLTHKRSFEVADGVECIPPNDLPRYAPGYSSYTVLGSGKTAMDSILWLLEMGADPNSVTWVRPRDAWLLNRKHIQPSIEFFDETINGLACQLEIMATSKSVSELCLLMENAGFWLRLDTDVWPEMFHAATVSEIELCELQKINNIVKAGHVRRIEPNQMVMENTLVLTEPGQLYVDCTASGLDGRMPDLAPVFSPGRINLQMIRIYQPTFSAALIGFLEAKVDDEVLILSASRVTHMTDTVEDWMEQRIVGMMNQKVWNENPAISEWLRKCRLEIFGSALAALDPDDINQMAVMERIKHATPEASKNTTHLLDRGNLSTR